MMHEMVQIRAGVAAGLFLWAIYYYVEKRKLLALWITRPFLRPKNFGFSFTYSSSSLNFSR
jgi:hypothetical protein